MKKFKPSDVAMCANSYLPFVAGFDHAESEFAAAIIVRTCQARGDEWQPVSLKVAQEVLREDMEAKREPFASLLKNPFFHPDVWELVDKGFAEWADKKGGSLNFTEKGFERLDRFVK